MFKYLKTNNNSVYAIEIKMFSLSKIVFKLFIRYIYIYIINIKYELFWYNENIIFTVKTIIYIYSTGDDGDINELFKFTIIVV